MGRPQYHDTVTSGADSLDLRNRDNFVLCVGELATVSRCCYFCTRFFDGRSTPHSSLRLPSTTSVLQKRDPLFCQSGCSIATRVSGCCNTVRAGRGRRLRDYPRTSFMKLDFKLVEFLFDTVGSVLRVGSGGVILQ